MLEEVTKLEKSRAALNTDNKELRAQVESFEATIAKNKNMVDEADGVMNHNIELRVELREKSEKLAEIEESCKMAKGLVASSAKKLEDSHTALLACMREVKVALDAVFAKAGSEPCAELLDTDPVAFSV